MRSVKPVQLWNATESYVFSTKRQFVLLFPIAGPLSIIQALAVGVNGPQGFLELEPRRLQLDYSRYSGALLAVTRGGEAASDVRLSQELAKLLRLGPGHEATPEQLV